MSKRMTEERLVRFRSSLAAPGCLMSRQTVMELMAETTAARASEAVLEARVKALENFLRNASAGECFSRREPEDYCVDCSTLRPDDPCFCCRAQELLKEPTP